MNANQPEMQVLEPDTSLETWLKDRACAEGFDVARITHPDSAGDAGDRLREFIANDFHGDMTWLAEKAGRRAHPSTLWPDVQAIVMLGLNYGPATNPLLALENKSKAAISVYAQGRDYHDVIKSKLKAVARDFANKSGADVKVFVDTAPVMEKPLAQAAGLGWQGKHTNLVSREFGSWLFLGAIFTTAALAPDAPETDHCGQCRRCLDICPTAAFPAPYKLDARRCISYLTIEHKGQIPREYRRAIGNRIYGCDDCLAVCPWNKFANTAREIKFAPMAAANNPPLAELLGLDDAQFRARFAGSPVKRIGRDRFVRNVLIAAGNSGNLTLAPRVISLLHDRAPMVRGLAVWAIRNLVPAAGMLDSVREDHLSRETDLDARMEWDLPL